MRINCGGFELNENDFELDGETLSLKNSGGAVSGEALVTIMNDDTGTLDKTLGEIIAAMPLVYIDFVKNVEGGTVTEHKYYPVLEYMIRSNGYGEVLVNIEGNTATFTAYSLDDYPVASQN